MKLAEALMLRKDCQVRIDELETRLLDNIKCPFRKRFTVSKKRDIRAFSKVRFNKAI